jgi:hypothetical protein
VYDGRLRFWDIAPVRAFQKKFVNAQGKKNAAALIRLTLSTRKAQHYNAESDR